MISLLQKFTNHLYYFLQFTQQIFIKVVYLLKITTIKCCIKSFVESVVILSFLFINGKVLGHHHSWTPRSSCTNVALLVAEMLQYKNTHRASYVTSRKSCYRGWLTDSGCIMKTTGLREIQNTLFWGYKTLMCPVLKTFPLQIALYNVAILKKFIFV